MKIELKSIKYAHHLSEETIAFSAKVYVDGKKVGEVSNSGRGESPRMDVPWSIQEEMEKYAKSLPATPSEFHEGEFIPMQLEFLISDILNEDIKAKDRKKQDNFVKKVHIKHKSAGKKTLRINTEKETLCLALSPSQVVTQKTIDEYAKDKEIKIDSWEVYE